MSNGHYWECNLAAVWGQIATGGGHAPLTESMGILGILSLTKKSFMSIEKWIGQWWWALLEDSLKGASAAEKAIVISNRRYHQGVLVDGG